MEYLIGLDIGTSAVKGVLMSKSGKIIETETIKFEYYYEENKKLLDPNKFVKTCCDVISTLAKKTDGQVKAICSCCASGNLILLDNKDNPMTPIIGWQNEIPKEITDKFFTPQEKSAFYESVGWRWQNGFPVSCLAEIKLHKKDIFDKAKTVAMSAEYLNFCLTGKWGISNSMGTPFMFIKQETGEYNAETVSKLGAEDKFFPPIMQKGAVLGNILPSVAEKLNLSSETKVVLGTFDHPSGALGAGVFEENEMLLSCGTSWVEFFPAKTREFAISTKGLVDRFMLDGSPYCIMKSVPSVSVKIDALREHYLGNISHKEYDELVKKSSFGCNNITFDFTDDDFDKYKDANKSDIARAIIETAAYKLKDNLALLKESGLNPEKITMIGGISNSAVCTDVVSEVLGLPISVVNGQSAGAVGSCLLAGIGAGIFKNEKEAFKVMISQNG